MALEDYLEPEVGIAVLVTAAAASPRVRKLLRRGAVYGVAGVLKAKDKLTEITAEVAENARQRAESSRAAKPETAAAPAAS